MDRVSTGCPSWFWFRSGSYFCPVTRRTQLDRFAQTCFYIRWKVRNCCLSRKWQGQSWPLYRLVTQFVTVGMRVSLAISSDYTRNPWLLPWLLPTSACRTTSYAWHAPLSHWRLVRYTIYTLQLYWSIITLQLYRSLVQSNDKTVISFPLLLCILKMKFHL